MSTFGDSITFMVKLGVYDVVLPFLLVFTITFALLDKTRVLGMDTGRDGKEYAKKNINAMVSFVLAFFVVASSQLVAVINKTLSEVFLLLLLIICVLLLAGSFHQQTKEGFFLKPGTWPYKLFMIIVVISVIAIFLNALGWDMTIYNFLKDNWNTSYVASVIFIILIIGFMVYITKEPEGKAEAKKEES